jgi:hypothetical protein
MHLVSRSAPNGARELDDSWPLVDAMAQDLWRLYGAGGSLDWDGVERHLQRIADEARRGARVSRPVPVPVAARPKSHAGRTT